MTLNEHQRDKLMNVQYPNVYYWLVFMLRGGVKDKSPGENWNPLFEAQ